MSITRQQGDSRSARFGPPGLALTVAAALLFSACGGDDEASVASAETAEAATADVALAEASAGDIAIDAAAAEQSAPASEVVAEGTDGLDGPSVDIGVIGRDVIVEMHVVMESDDIERSVASISAQAAALGGGVAAADVNFAATPAVDETTPATASGHAVLTVKVPPDQVDQFVQGLEATGAVLSINQNAQDVTTQLVDLDVRIANARQSVENVRTFMTQATNLTDLVQLESELTRRQTELEQLEAQKRNMADRVALATITIEIMPSPIVVPDEQSAPEDDSGIGDAFADGWKAFTAIAFGVAYAFAVLAPFLAVAAVLGLVVWIFARRQRRLDTERQLTNRSDRAASSGTDLPSPPANADSEAQQHEHV